MYKILNPIYNKTCITFIVISYYRGETRSLEYASTRVVNSRYD